MSGELVYVGYGSRDRAWKCPPYNPKFYNSGLRSPEHSAWMDGLLEEGYTPASWVQIEMSFLPKEDAYRFEQEMIKDLKPRFNKDPSLAQKSVPVEDREIMIALRKQGLTLQQIVDETGWSMMTVHKYTKES